MNFCPEIFREIFHEIFLNISKISRCFFRLYTHPFNMQAVLRIVHYNKVPVSKQLNKLKVSILLLCMNSITTNLIYFNHVFKSFKSLNIEN